MPWCFHINMSRSLSLLAYWPIRPCPCCSLFQSRRLYIIPAVKEHHEVTVTFQLPCLRDQYTTKPDHYISHLVGHEGPGSLLSALKVRQWYLFYILVHVC